MLSDFFRLSFKNLIYRRLRSWLTIIGIIIGVGLIVALVYLGEGMKNAVMGQMQMFGTDLLYVLPGSDSNPLLGIMGGSEFRKKDEEAVRGVAGIMEISATNTDTAKAKFLGEEQTLMLYGGELGPLYTLYNESLALREGAWNTNDNSNEIMIGSLLADKQFKNTIRAGDEISIKNKKMTVAGIFKISGDTGVDNSVFLSFVQFERLTGRSQGYSNMIIKLLPGYDANLVAMDIKSAIESQSGSIEATVLTSEKVGDIAGSILGIIEIILGSIAVVSLLVGGVGIMNTMYTAVLERTREIGVMKALGATNNQVLTIFLIEAGTVGLVGGVIGVSGGLGLAYLVQFAAKSQGFTYLDVSLRLGMLFFILFLTFLFGAVAGVLPARQAAGLKPAKALRAE